MYPNVTSNIWTKVPFSSLHFGAVVALAEVTSMSAQFIICRPLALLVYGPRIKKAFSQARWKKRQAERALNIQWEGGKVRRSEAACQSFILHYWLAVKQIIHSWTGSNVAVENSRSSRQCRAVSFPSTSAACTHFVPTNSSIMKHVAVPFCPLKPQSFKKKNTHTSRKLHCFESIDVGRVVWMNQMYVPKYCKEYLFVQHTISRIPIKLHSRGYCKSKTVVKCKFIHKKTHISIFISFQFTGENSCTQNTKHLQTP